DERRHGDVLGSRFYFGSIALKKTGRLGLTRRRRIRNGLSYPAEQHAFADPDPVQPSFKAQNHSLLPPRGIADSGVLLLLQCHSLWSSLIDRIRADRPSKRRNDQRLHESLLSLPLLDHSDNEPITAVLLAGRGGGSESWLAGPGGAHLLVGSDVRFLCLLQALRSRGVHQVSPARVSGLDTGGLADCKRSPRPFQQVGQRAQSGATGMGRVSHLHVRYAQSRAALHQKIRCIQYWRW